ncbi:MAG: hypothetical protein HUK22_08050, partial [Thermoguttaceae bacterium]|nr:hypothetical protein [Thermoguttaceae bacterium]
GAVEFFANATVKGADKNDETEFSAKSSAIDANEWVKVTGEFSVPKTNEYGSIRLNFAPADGSYLDIDQISVFPRSWKEKSHGLRPDLLQAIKEIAPEIIRWPGGCYASAYRWKDGIGPQDDRGAFPFEIWNDVDVNSFGIDEFVPFCREVGAEPDMVVNIGTAQWESHLRHVDWMQEVCDWVEYCNGPADSKWGAIRAKNGHPEPYGIKYWEIDNEVRPSDSPSEWYVGVLRELIPRMKKIDPNIKIIACGSWTGDGPRWNREVVEGAGDIIDYISTHRYDDPNGFATNPWSNQYYFESHRKVFENSANPNIKFFHSEWNAQSTDWRTGLHAGGILNCFERVGDLVAIATPALFLRHVSGTAWDNAFVNFDHREWFPAPNYVVMKLWRDNYAPTLVELKSDAEDMNGQMPLINAVATKSEDGKTLYFKAVNNKKTAVEYNLTLDGAKATAVEATLVSPEGDDADAKLRARNDLGAIRISPREAAAKIIDGKVVG